MSILELLWEQGVCTVKQAHARIGEERDVTHNTTQSTMKRLWEKDLLKRKKQGHAYLYSPCLSRRELTGQMVADLVDEIAGSQIEVALQAFVDLADATGKETLAQLEELVARCRREDEEAGS